MIENSLDAKATMIKIEVFKAGTDVKVSDNGIGMDKGRYAFVGRAACYF